MVRGRETLGMQELALLRHIAEKGPLTVREITNDYGLERGLSRSTILTMVERLRTKGRLKRHRSDGVYQYMTSVPSTQLLKSVVRDFVDTALEGSFSPFVSYLADAPDLSERDLADLEKLVGKLRARRSKAK